ncbi:MAG: PASTA domain-containing protein [Bacilli bacterium]|nr:PASTA domain-containing protein [Bacilli bacterium]
MKDRKINTNKLRVNKFVYFFVFFLFVLFSITIGYRCLADYKVNNITFSEFIKNRNINEEIIMPDRGTIYDTKGNILAQDVSSYTLIAYLDESRSENSEELRHVKDVEGTALALSEHINTSYERILEILNKDAYQVEFGTGGKNLSQLEMEAIKELDLPGIDFIKSTKRYYPNGDFASYLLGYTKNKEDENGNMWITGELGIEGYYNEVLTGKSGYLTYEKDGRGNKIANSNEYKEDAVNGANINLTIDNSVQLFIENAVKDAQKKSEAEWIVIGVMDAKTGKILAYTSTPSFDPNIRNLTNYMDPLVSYAYEPGSTMKTFSYMCAIESGRYNGSDTFKSGSKTYVSELDENDTVTIKDWNNKGWGTITYDYGYAMSSNIGVATLMEEVITKKELSECYTKYGFGKKTGITLNRELSGDIKFTYDVEAATAAYGQGITITPIQMLQALTTVANDGVMLKPYIVSSVVSSSGEILEKYDREEIGRVASSTTIKKIKELMKSVIVKDSNMGTGAAYYMEGYDLIGKTGTASIYDYESGKYLTGNSDYIYSFSGLYPGKDPELIVYMAVKKPKDSRNYIAPAVKDIIVNLSKYYNIDSKNNLDSGYELDDYVNKSITTVKKVLEEKNIKVLILGNGNKIIGQYPSTNATLYKGDKVVLLTNNYKLDMIDFNEMSYKDADNILKLMGVEYKLEGYGYVYEQNIPIGNKIDKEVILKLKGKY